MAQVGFSPENPDLLEEASRQLLSENEASLDRQNAYGTFYRIQGDLHGPDDKLSTVTVWIQLTNDKRYRFVTLKPAR